MEIRNKIINYFLSKENNTPVVFHSSVTVSAKNAHTILSNQLKSEKKDPITGKLLHVCFDYDSKIIYLPNAHEFPQNTVQLLLDAVKIKIINDYGEFSRREPIIGSPYTSLRIRSIESFPYSYKALTDKIGLSPEVVKMIPIIEANLSRMPSVVKQLPSIYKCHNGYPGSYIGKNDITFVDEIDIDGKIRNKPIVLLKQKSPFILINISPEAQTGIDTKEQVILNGFNDFINEQSSSFFKDKNINITPITVLQRAKHYLYLGFPFEEVCRVFLDGVENHTQFVNGGKILIRASQELLKENYNTKLFNYYITCKTDKCIQSCDIFNVIENKNGFIIIETPLYMSNDLCRRILDAQGSILIVQYNSIVNKIDVKSQHCVYNDMKRSNIDQVKKLYLLCIMNLKKQGINVDKIEFRSDEKSSGISLSNSKIFNVRKISDYYYACDFIKDMCRFHGLEFKDITVLLGPIEQLMGRGTRGGFIDKELWKKNGFTIPYEIVKGIFVKPPLIAVDTNSMPSYSRQSDTLIHEFSHYLYNIANPLYKSKYNEDPKLRQKDKNQYFYLYFTDMNERQAHKYQIKFLLLSGMSIDEIIRDKVGGIIDMSNYGVAMKYKELVDEVVIKLEKENKA